MSPAIVVLLVIVAFGVLLVIGVGAWIHARHIDKAAASAAGAAASTTLAAARTALTQDANNIATKAAQAAVDLAKKL
ncbi:MAG: hypothetical protein KGI71_06505 [Patescibacteria group bacterium]|nr:hypothetical protein [Patescibacteria group bacterium]